MTRAAAAIAAGLGLALAGCAGGTQGTGDAGTVAETPADAIRSEVDRRDAGDELVLATTQAEPAGGNAAWCGTMQLCWNSLMDDMNGGKPVEFSDPSAKTDEVEHLNERLFSTDDLSPDHYYTYAGPMTEQAKGEIEDAIAERFDQESDILDKFAGWGSPGAQFLYAMLYRQFSFATPFSVSDGVGRFGSSDNGNVASNVAYFEATDDEQRQQVEPLYYDDADHNAVRIATKGGDEIVLVRNPEGLTLEEMWNGAMVKADVAEADETKPLGKDDTFKCPNLDIDMLRQDYDWVGKAIELSGDDGESDKWEISQAMQTLKLHLDNEGGEVKSEAGISLEKSTPMGEDTSRRFAYDDTFAMFVRDGNAGDDAQPYVGVLVSDITQFQEGAESK